VITATHIPGVIHLLHLHRMNIWTRLKTAANHGGSSLGFDNARFPQKNLGFSVVSDTVTTLATAHRVGSSVMVKTCYYIVICYDL